MRRLHPGPHALLTYGNPQRQGVDKHSQGPVSAITTLHPAHQYGAEHHILLARHLTQYLRPRQVRQAGNAHAQLPGLSPQAQVQRRRQDPRRLFDSVTVALHILQAKW